MAPNADFQRVVEAALPKETRLVVGCRSGQRSLQAAALLEAAGYAQVVDMRGGFAGERDMFGRVSVAGWAEAGLPVATKPEPGNSYLELEKTGR